MQDKWVVPVCCTLTILAVLCYLCRGGRQQELGPKGQGDTVTAKSLRFGPKKVEITEGESVVWVNKARTNHTATSDDDGKTFDTKEFKPGETTKPVKFEKAGEFKYHCKVHGKTMSGTVVVKAKAK